MDLLDHIEAHLGVCCRRWINDPRDLESSLADVGGLDVSDTYQVLRFDDRPMSAADTFLTYGLSRRVLAVHGAPDSKVRMELMISANRNVVGAAIAYVLMTMANAILRKREMPFNGEVIDWGVPVYENPAFQHIYCTEPLLLPESFASFAGTDPPTIFAWLVPVTSLEAQRIRAGVKFNDVLREKRPDVLAYDQREELVFNAD